MQATTYATTYSTLVSIFLCLIASCRDWSLVHLQSHLKLPALVLIPTKIQVKHIGVTEGMHEMDDKKKKRMKRLKFPEQFNPTRVYVDPDNIPNRRSRKGFGGWGHPADHQHCLQILEQRGQ